MATLRGLVFFAATSLQVFWFWMIARQHEPLIICASFLAVVHLSWLGSRESISKFGWPRRAALGAAMGYLAVIVSAFASECALRGSACLERDFFANLYFFPIVSFGWIYGALWFGLPLRVAREAAALPREN